MKKHIVKRYPKTFLSIVFIIGVGILLICTRNKNTESPLIQDIIRSEQAKQNEPDYRPVTPYAFKVTEAAKLAPYLTDMAITPDNKYILSAALDGTVHILSIQDDGTLKAQSKPFFRIHTSNIGYPRIEIGLTGIALGADFETSGDVFLLYSYDNESAGDTLLRGGDWKARLFENRITKVHFNKTDGGIYGTDPKLVFQGETLTSQAHQIERGAGVMIAGKPHLLFAIGDGYESSQALDLSKEAGKLMLIQADGSDPAGVRPYPDHPKIQAIGLRNGSSIRYDAATGAALLTDTSNENYDRLISGKVFDPRGASTYPLSFNWAGDDINLLQKVYGPYDSKNDLVSYRWSPSETPVDSLKLQDGRTLVITFGETKSPRNKPGKRIVISNGKGGFEGLVERSPSSFNRLGNPISLEQDTRTGRIYFADFEEGKIFSFSLNN